LVDIYFSNSLRNVDSQEWIFSLALAIAVFCKTAILKAAVSIGALFARRRSTNLEKSLDVSRSALPWKMQATIVPTRCTLRAMACFDDV